MLCYAKEYSPRSKTSLQGRECRVLGYSATQKGFLLLEVSTGKKFVSPHVHFVWGEFPGLMPLDKAKRGTFSQPSPPNASGLELPHGAAPAPTPQPPHVPGPTDDGEIVPLPLY
eukprot:1375157-Prymnesium_polylepis.1